MQKKDTTTTSTTSTETETQIAILRLDINPNETVKVSTLPKGAEITDLGPDPMRGGSSAMWFLGDRRGPEAPEQETRVFVRAETGQPIPYDAGDLTYIGRTVGLGKSASQPGEVTPRTVHWFEANGDTRETLESLADKEAA